VGGYILDVLDILLMQMLDVIDISTIIIYSLYKKKVTARLNSLG
jgi:hypothetical protein